MRDRAPIPFSRNPSKLAAALPFRPIEAQLAAPISWLLGSMRDAIFELQFWATQELLTFSPAFR